MPNHLVGPRPDQISLPRGSIWVECNTRTENNRQRRRILSKPESKLLESNEVVNVRHSFISSTRLEKGGSEDTGSDSSNTVTEEGSSVGGSSKVFAGSGRGSGGSGRLLGGGALGLSGLGSGSGGSGGGGGLDSIGLVGVLSTALLEDVLLALVLAHGVVGVVGDASRVGSLAHEL